MAGNLAVLYDVEWQIRRCEMLSVNNDYGGWWTATGVERNLALCEDYIDSVGKFTAEQEVRKWRVTNLLNATLLGYGQRDDVDDALRERVREFRERCKFQSTTVAYCNIHWDWDTVALDVKALSVAKAKMVYDNLKKRVKTSARRNGEARKFTHRKELEIFVDLLKERLEL